MIIKKFQAATEEEAIRMAQVEMGNSAVIMHIRTVKHRALARLFKKNYVEVTAALKETTDKIPVATVNATVNQDTKPLLEIEKTTNAIEAKLNNLQNIMEKKISEAESVDKDTDTNNLEDNTKNSNNVNFKFMQLVYRQLIDNEVDEKYVNQIMGEVEESLKKGSNVDSLLAAIYQKIVLKMGVPEIITPVENKTKVIYFVGPTGVGKTTTIAKLASYFKLQKNLKIAMITSDTYRIAAVEQLRTYANILDTPLTVVYTIEELNEAVRSYADYDMIFVDTAGRSQKNIEQCNEIFRLIDEGKLGENMEKDVYLVLSAATKYKDLLKICDVFGHLKDYKLIFTKLDETYSLGNILNVKLNTGAPLSYVTSGQVVPDDISTIDAQKIARSLLGSNE